MTINAGLQRAETGTRTTDGFGTREIERRGETQSSALAQQARANVEARFIVARSSPRDLDDVRVRLLRECRRPGFADVARYAKPVGNKSIVGPSIRFVEAALRYFGNATVESSILYEDAESRQLRITVTDLETNTTYASDAMVAKLVERRSLKQGQHAVSQRVNSYGDTVFLIHATEDELLNKAAAIVSKAVRTLGLRMIPGDIVEECMQEVVDTQGRQDAADPSSARKRICDSFSSLGVMPSDLAAFLGHAIDGASPDEIRQLREAYAAIRDGESTWRAVMEARTEEREIAAPVKTTASAKSGALGKIGVKIAASSAATDETPSDVAESRKLDPAARDADAGPA